MTAGRGTPPLTLAPAVRAAVKEEGWIFKSFPRASRDARVIDYFDGIAITALTSIIRYYKDQTMNGSTSCFGS